MDVSFFFPELYISSRDEVQMEMILLHIFPHNQKKFTHTTICAYSLSKLHLQELPEYLFQFSNKMIVPLRAKGPKKLRVQTILKLSSYLLFIL